MPPGRPKKQFEDTQEGKRLAKRLEKEDAKKVKAEEKEEKARAREMKKVEKEEKKEEKARVREMKKAEKEEKKEKKKDLWSQGLLTTSQVGART